MLAFKYVDNWNEKVSIWNVERKTCDEIFHNGKIILVKKFLIKWENSCNHEEN